MKLDTDQNISDATVFKQVPIMVERGLSLIKAKGKEGHQLWQSKFLDSATGQLGENECDRIKSLPV